MIIGVTGRIASGKSTVTEYFCNKGYHIVDADLIARAILREETIGYNQVLRYFGEKIINKKDNEINRQALGKLVFNNHEKLKVLNAITHPLIEYEIKEQIHKLRFKRVPIVLDMPLLLNNNDIIQRCTSIVNVIVDKDIQIERLMNRNKNLTMQEVNDRINCIGRWKYDGSYKVIDIPNNGTMEELIDQLKKQRL